MTVRQRAQKATALPLVGDNVTLVLVFILSIFAQYPIIWRMTLSGQYHGKASSSTISTYEI